MTAPRIPTVIHGRAPWVLTAACLLTALSLLLSPTDARADKSAARKFATQAQRSYNVGDFEDAAKLYKQAYKEHPAPELLYNLGQSYRQIGDCRRAKFFYKRFIQQSDNEAQVNLSKAFLTELESCASASAQEVDQDGDIGIPGPAASEPTIGGPTAAREPAALVQSEPIEPAQTPTLAWVGMGVGAAAIIAGGVLVAMHEPEFSPGVIQQMSRTNTQTAGIATLISGGVVFGASLIYGLAQ